MNSAPNSLTSFYFETIEPNLYTIRIIYDDNANNEWDTGNYLAKKQAEQIIYFPKEIDVRELGCRTRFYFGLANIKIVSIIQKIKFYSSIMLSHFI